MSYDPSIEGTWRLIVMVVCHRHGLVQKFEADNYEDRVVVCYECEAEEVDQREPPPCTCKEEPDEWCGMHGWWDGVRNRQKKPPRTL